MECFDPTNIHYECECTIKSNLVLNQHKHTRIQLAGIIIVDKRFKLHNNACMMWNFPYLIQLHIA